MSVTGPGGQPDPAPFRRRRASWPRCTGGRRCGGRPSTELVEPTCRGSHRGVRPGGAGLRRPGRPACPRPRSAGSRSSDSDVHDLDGLERSGRPSLRLRRSAPPAAAPSRARSSGAPTEPITCADVQTILVASDAPTLRGRGGRPSSAGRTSRSTRSPSGPEVMAVRGRATPRSGHRRHADGQHGRHGRRASSSGCEESYDASSDHIPVLMLLDRRPDVFLARRSGAEGWLVKPLDPLRLRRAVTALLDDGTYFDESLRPCPCWWVPDPQLAAGAEPAGRSGTAVSTTREHRASDRHDAIGRRRPWRRPAEGDARPVGRTEAPDGGGRRPGAHHPRRAGTTCATWTSARS